MFKRGDIANNLFLICFTHMECILCGWGRIGYSDVSIHAPARGATKFQTGMFYASVVSIHAPTRGATSSFYFHTFGVSGFNPRTHTGCDGGLLSGLQEVRPVSIHAPTRGATYEHSPPPRVIAVSIHAPTRGATQFAGRLAPK